MTPTIIDCGGLAFTGISYSILAIVILAIACVVVGVMVFGLARRRRRFGFSLTLLLVLGACSIIGMVGSTSAGAATPGCGASSPAPSTTSSSALTVVQTSKMTDLAPGVPAILITGTSTNDRHDNVFVEMVEVRIGSVAKAPHAVAGSCDARDYVILNPQMFVNQSVPPRGSVQFTGATIGFDDRVSNQDACKGATVRLTYEVYSS